MAKSVTDILRVPTSRHPVSSTLEEVLKLVKQLSAVDKVRLIEQVTPEIRRELTLNESKSRKSLRGLWTGIDITDDDIAEVRQQMWKNFPREERE